MLNLPLALLTVIASLVLVPESRDPASKRLDVPGAAFSSAALAALVVGLIEAPSRGWLSPAVLGAFATAIAVVAAFAARELRARQPMLDLRWFADSRLAVGTIAITLGSLCLAGLTFNLTQYLQVARGYSPFQAGLAIFPLSAGFILGAGASNRLGPRLGAKRLVPLGLVLVAAGLAGATFLDAATDYWLLAALIAAFGIGGCGDIRAVNRGRHGFGTRRTSGCRFRAE
jgi:Na+/melibiose symporter-like transporter